MRPSIIKPSGKDWDNFRRWLSRATVGYTKHTEIVRSSITIPEQLLQTLKIGEPWGDQNVEAAAICIEQLNKTGELPHANEIMHRLCMSGAEAKASWILSQLDGTQIVVFAQYTPTLDILSKCFADAGRSFTRVDGTTPPTDRVAYEKAFQQGETEIFLAQQIAGGISI